MSMIKSPCRDAAILWHLLPALHLLRNRVAKIDPSSSRAAQAQRCFLEIATILGEGNALQLLPRSTTILP